MAYLIVPTRRKAEQISEALYDLRRPNPDPADVTTRWVGIIDHKDGRAALHVPSGAGRARIDPSAVPDTFVDLVKEHLNAQEIEDAKQAVRDKRGTRVALGEIIPQRIKRRVSTEAEMEADGWRVGIE